jgi:phosphomannomutase
MDRRGAFVDPHRILALAARYLVEQRGWRGKLVKTVSTTQMINRLGEKYGLEVIETPVGFNHIADWMLKSDVLIGGEESGGMSFKGHIPEGDGVLMGLLLIEMVAARRAPLDEQVRQLLEDFGPSHYQRLDLRLSHPIPKERMVEQLVTRAPAAIGGAPVRQVSATDGVKYTLNDDSWLLIRPSGTEPVLRIYAEAREPEMVQALLDHGRSLPGLAG